MSGNWAFIVAHCLCHTMSKTAQWIIDKQSKKTKSGEFNIGDQRKDESKESKEIFLELQILA